MTHDQEFLRVVDGAGLTKIELAAVYGVSRQTIHAWVKNGPPKLGTYIAAIEGVITRALLHAIGNGALPLKPSAKLIRASKIERMRLLMQPLKPALPK